MRRRLRLLRWLGSLAVLGFGLWLLGLAAFVIGSLSIQDSPTERSDAIVVLTGGKMRVETGVDLLAAGMAKKLFISGVNRGVERDELLHTSGPLAERASCCTVLGHEAVDTVGNARETAVWMRDEGYRSLRLVTSWYHIRRATLEFARAMPETTIIAHPVFAQHLELDRWLSRHGPPLLVIGEYDKYLAAWVRPALLPAMRTAETWIARR